MKKIIKSQRTKTKMPDPRTIYSSTQELLNQFGSGNCGFMQGKQKDESEEEMQYIRITGSQKTFGIPVSEIIQKDDFSGIQNQFKLDQYGKFHPIKINNDYIILQQHQGDLLPLSIKSYSLVEKEQQSTGMKNRLRDTGNNININGKRGSVQNIRPKTVFSAFNKKNTFIGNKYQDGQNVDLADINLEIENTVIKEEKNENNNNNNPGKIIYSKQNSSSSNSSQNNKKNPKRIIEIANHIKQLKQQEGQNKKKRCWYRLQECLYNCFLRRRPSTAQTGNQESNNSPQK